MIIGFLKGAIDFLTGSSYGIYYNQENGKSKQILEFDTIMECEFSSTSSITSYPIESGYERTDYKFNDPSIITMRGETSKYRAFGQFFDWSGSSLVQKVSDELELFKSGIYDLTVLTKGGARQHYTLQDYFIPETPDEFGLLVVEMTFKQIMADWQDQAVEEPSLMDTVSAGIVKLKEGVTNAFS